MMTLDRKLANLTERQYRFLEELIRIFVEMCEENSG
jgi:hypothetical protein